MICNAQTGGKNSDLIKQAYSAGIYDTLYTPLKQDELYEALEVLLKFQRHCITPPINTIPSALSLAIP